MTEQEWEEHLDYLDSVEILPYLITVGGSHHYGHGQVVPHLFVTLEEKIEMNTPIASSLNDSQRAQLLQLYKSKLQSLGDEVFFDQFDSIRLQCYDEIGINLEEIEAMERSKAASKLGKHGGESTSEAKSQAARDNGRKGGRKKETSMGLSLEDI